MIYLLLALAGLLGVSLLALSCCGPPGSSKLSCNGSSHDRVETALERDRGSRKITVIEAENINHDVKEKTLEDERKKTRERINRSRAAKSNNRSNQEQLPRRRKARDDRDSSEKPSDKGGGGGGGVRRKTTKVEKDPLRPVSSSDPFSKHSDAKKVENDGDDASTKEAGTGVGGGNSKTPMDDSQKGGGSRCGGNSGLPSTERVGTNETMVSRERADELESAKLKKEREAKTPAMQSNETQMDSDSKKPKKTPPKPKRRLSKRKEAEVRQWNEAIARGNVFRPRKDDETVDEVHVDWNG